MFSNEDCIGLVGCPRIMAVNETKFFIDKRNASACVLSEIYCPVTRYLDGGTDLRDIFHDGTHRSQTQSLFFWGRYPQGTPKSKILGL